LFAKEPAAAMREFNVLSDTHGAEYGKRAGGQISIVTSSGTNQLHSYPGSLAAVEASGQPWAYSMGPEEVSGL
jgi:hypothetical protein